MMVEVGMGVAVTEEVTFNVLFHDPLWCHHGGVVPFQGDGEDAFELGSAAGVGADDGALLA